MGQEVGDEWKGIAFKCHSEGLGTSGSLVLALSWCWVRDTEEGLGLS